MEPLYTRRHRNVPFICICSSLSCVWQRYKNYITTGYVVFIFTIYQFLNTGFHESVLEYVTFHLPRIKYLIQWLMCHLSGFPNIHANDYSQTYCTYPILMHILETFTEEHKGNFTGLSGVLCSTAKWQKIKPTMSEIIIISTWTGFWEPTNTLQFRKKTNTYS